MSSISQHPLDLSWANYPVRTSVIRIILWFFSTLDGDENKRGWTSSFRHPTPPVWGQVRGRGMKTNRGKERHDGNLRLGRFKLLHTHPVYMSSPLLSQGSACQLIEPRKAAKRSAEMHRDRGEIQQVWSPATMNSHTLCPSIRSLQVVECAACGFCCESLWCPIKARYLFAHFEKCEKQ